MPRFKIHCAISKKRTGNDFGELHKWIDQPSKSLGVNHRRRRHSYNKKDKNTIMEYWNSKGKGLGEKAVIEWLFHIALDNLDTAFKMSKKSFSYAEKTYNLIEFGLSESGYIHCSFKCVDDSELGSLFKEE